MSNIEQGMLIFEVEIKSKVGADYSYATTFYILSHATLGFKIAGGYFKTLQT